MKRYTWLYWLLLTAVINTTTLLISDNNVDVEIDEKNNWLCWSPLLLRPPNNSNISLIVDKFEGKEKVKVEVVGEVVDWTNLVGFDEDGDDRSGNNLFTLVDFLIKFDAVKADEETEEEVDWLILSFKDWLLCNNIR